MKHIFVCPMDDSITFAGFDVRSDNALYGTLSFQSYTPPEAAPYPYVPAYFQMYNQQRKPLKQFLREHLSGMRARAYLLALHDDATDLEAHALSELLIACGAKETLMEYRAFLLSAEPAYLAVTGSKRAVTVTHVVSEKDDTERIFIPVNLANPDTIQDAMHELDPDGKLPVFSFGLPGAIPQIGEAVSEPEILRSFIKML